MPPPAISIGLPVFNGESYLATAIESILNQTFGDFELIISDNTSTDGTAAICEHYAGIDNRIRYLRLPQNCGAAPNYRRVFNLSRGKYFKWATHDDACLPGFLEACMTAIEQAPPSVALVYARSQIIDAAGHVTRVDGESIESRDPRGYRRAMTVMRKVNLAWGLFGVIRSETLRKTRLIDWFIGSDYVLLAELAMLGEIWELPDVLMQKRVHPGISNVVHQTRSQWLTWMDPSRKHRGSFLPSYVRIGQECAKSIMRLPLTPSERILAGLTVPWVWYFRNFRRIAGHYKQRIKAGRSRLLSLALC